MLTCCSILHKYYLNLVLNFNNVAVSMEGSKQHTIYTYMFLLLKFLNQYTHSIHLYNIERMLYTTVSIDIYLV